MQPSIFVSSTFYDLKYVRESLCNFIKNKGYTPVLSNNGDIGYSSNIPLDVSCYEAVSNCHMTVLIVGGEYGSAATGEDDSNKFNEYLSITRKEFRKANESNISIFSFVSQGVMNEYNIYRENKDNIEKGILNIKFKETKNINVFRFIEELYSLHIPVFEFNDVNSIERTLEKQWADMLRKYLVQNMKQIKNDPDDNASELSIEGEWVSVFVEQNSILNENIVVTQKGRNVKALFTLGNRKYEFVGKFKNRILMGEYVSKNARKDERGNMMLKLFGDSLLSGYITFVYKNEQVNTSPYVWTLKSRQDLTQGAYGFCDECVKRNRKCCCANEDVDMPILLPFEVDNIGKKHKINQIEFCESRSQNLYQMKRRPIAGTNLNGCHFYDGQRCTIYNERPIDCRLFPFDIAFLEGEYKLIYYTSICPSCVGLSASEIEEISHTIKPFLTLMQPFLSECTFTQYNEKLRLHNYRVVGPLSKIF